MLIYHSRKRIANHWKATHAALYYNQGYKHPHNKTHTVKGVTGGGATNLGLVNRLVTVYRKFQVRCQKILTHAHNLYAQQVLEQRTCTCWQRTGNFLYQHFKGRCDSLVYQILPSPFYPHFIYNIPFMGVFYSSYPLWIVWVNGLTLRDVLAVRGLSADGTLQLNPKPLTKDCRSRHSNPKDRRSRCSNPKDRCSQRFNTKDRVPGVLNHRDRDP